MSDTALATATPYPGLRPYEKHEQANFFGRDAERDILIDKLLANRLTLLFAASGVGKSSLLNAAVIPRLEDPLGEHLSVVCHSDWVLQPLTGLLDALKDALPHAPDDATTLPDLLGVASLFVRQPLVVILDQFEEFFRYQRGTDEYHALIEQLTEVIIDPQLPVNVVISMREDFALELNAFKPKLPTLLFENYYRLEKMNRANAQRAILTPVEQLGYRYEPELLERLLEDLNQRSRDEEQLPHEAPRTNNEAVEPPYLQIVCSRLWDLNRADPDKLLRLELYEKAGGADGILEHFLGKVLTRFSHKEKQLASKAFDYLVAQRGVKMAYPADVLAKALRVKERALQQVLEKLAHEDVRILRRTQRGGVTWYELYHDMFSPSIESWNSDWKKRQLKRQRRVMGSAIITLLLALAFLIESFLWILRHDFPAEYLFTQQKFRLMDWGVIPEPLPEVVAIPLPDGEFQVGELDKDFGEMANSSLKNSGSYQRQNFGYPATTASLTTPFSIGRYEVTYEQYDYYVWQVKRAGDTAIIYPTGGIRNNGRGQHPVTYVSWDEAIAYTQWLSKHTEQHYRLPTEVEWEYAARAGTTTPYWWGEDTKGLAKANCRDCGSQWDNQLLALVGQFEANAYGLHDTAGNVWEWTCSAWQTEFDGSEQRCATTDDDNQRVLRGGSWFNSPDWLRSSSRHWYYSDNRNDNVGFRIILPRTP